jgi:DNA-binding beta-propeller fold protein YncE
MKRLATLLLAAAALALLAAAPSSAQDISYTVTDNLQLPRDTFMGQAMGVATNSKGHVFVYTRNGEPTVSLGGSRAFAHGGSNLYEFAPDGKFIRRLDPEAYGFLAAQQVRVDAHDNIWVVDSYSSMVMEFDPNGHVLMLLGRKPESVDIPQAPDRGRAKQGAPIASGMDSDLFEHPADVAWDASGNIFVADGLANARVIKFSPDGVFIKSWGSRGSGNGEFRTAHSIAVDASGNVYVADRGNNRIQVFDNDGNFKSAITSAGDPQALCITKGPHQYLYSSNSNPVTDIDHGGEISKMELDGTLVARFGHAGTQLREFGAVNEIDCRAPGQLYLAEAGNWRVTKVNLH